MNSLNKFVAVAFFVSTIFAHTGVAQPKTVARIQELNASFAAADPESREATLEKFRVELKGMLSPGRRSLPRETIDVINASLPLLGTALQDPNEKVRSAALGCLLPIAARHSAATNASKQEGLNVANDQSIKGALVTLMMSNENPDTVRAPATWIYSEVFSPTPDVEKRWMSNFNPHEANEAKAILSGLLGNRTPSAEAKRFALEKLNDPEAGELILESVASMNTPPVETLPIIVQRFANSERPVERALVGKVIEKSGKAGGVYVPLLHQMADRETNPIVKQQLAKAAESLSGGPTQN